MPLFTLSAYFNLFLFLLHFLFSFSCQDCTFHQINLCTMNRVKMIFIFAASAKSTSQIYFYLCVTKVKKTVVPPLVGNYYLLQFHLDLLHLPVILVLHRFVVRILSFEFELLMCFYFKTLNWINFVGTSVSSTRPETKYTRVALINTEAFTIQKEDVFNEEPSCHKAVEAPSPPHPPHLLLADLASQRLDLPNQDVLSEGKTADEGITLDDDVCIFIKY